MLCVEQDDLEGPVTLDDFVGCLSANLSVRADGRQVAGIRALPLATAGQVSQPPSNYPQYSQDHLSPMILTDWRSFGSKLLELDLTEHKSLH